MVGNHFERHLTSKTIRWIRCGFGYRHSSLAKPFACRNWTHKKKKKNTNYRQRQIEIPLNGKDETLIDMIYIYILIELQQLQDNSELQSLWTFAEELSYFFGCQRTARKNLTSRLVSREFLWLHFCCNCCAQVLLTIWPFNSGNPFKGKPTNRWRFWRMIWRFWLFMDRVAETNRSSWHCFKHAKVADTSHCVCVTSLHCIRKR